MTAKNPPTKKKVAAKRNPLFLDNPTLDLGLDEGLGLLTPEQKQDKFMARWMEVFHPYSTWPRVFRKGEKNGERIFRDIKLYYLKRVVEGDWTEQKYVMVVNSILENRGGVNNYALDKMGALYDEERLPLQVRLRREKEREEQ